MREEKHKAVKRAFEHFLIDSKYYRAGDISASNISGVIAELLEAVRSAWRVDVCHTFRKDTIFGKN